MEDVSWLCLVAILGLIIMAIVVAVLAMKGYFRSEVKMDKKGAMGMEIEVGRDNKKAPQAKKLTQG